MTTAEIKTPAQLAQLIMQGTSGDSKRASQFLIEAAVEAMKAGRPIDTSEREWLKMQLMSLNLEIQTAIGKLGGS